MKTLPCIHDDELVVYIVTAPEYPFKRHGLKQYKGGETYSPSVFNTKSIKHTRMQKSDRKWSRIIDKRLHPKFGPIFLVRCKVSDFVDCMPGAVCAGSQYTLDAKKKVDSVEIKDIEFVDESCNPKSFVVVLNSPVVNFACKLKYLSNHTVSDFDTYEREHLKGSIWTPEFARGLFSQYKFQHTPILPIKFRMTSLNGEKRYLTSTEMKAYLMINPGSYYGVDMNSDTSRKLLKYFRKHPSIFV